MCAIAGILGSDAEREGRLRHMLHALRHRGPDGAGTFVDSHILLGHQRLSIIDLAGGRQPLLNAAGTLALVCNGEIYNYRELRADLKQRGYQFLTQSDCEVILALYEFHGDKLLDHLRGMFAFALWDAPRRRLLLARDHLGQKPLFYTLTPTGLAFSSEIKGLLAFDPALRRLDLRALDQYLALRLIAPPLTMFAGIRKLPPGHLMTVEAGRVSTPRPYWQLSYEPKLEGSEDALTDELEAHIVEALRLHLRSDVPVGALLSGGLDSGLLVAMLSSKLGVRKLPTFTLGLDYSRFDETPHARAVARRFGTEHHETALQGMLSDLLPDLIYHLDEPSDPLSFCMYRLASFVRKHVKVVIGGDGGDEMFGGYDRYYGNLLADRYRRIPRLLRRHAIGPALSLLPAARWYRSRVHQARWLHNMADLSGAERYAASLSYFYFDRASRAALYTPHAAAELAGFDAAAPLIEAYESIDAEPLDRMLYTDSCIRLPDHPVMITDRMSMAHGLEARSPFMDHRLAEFAARVRCSLKVHGRTLRHLQRRLASRYLPAEVLNRPKQGFSSALPYLAGAQYAALCRSFVYDSHLVAADILRAEPVRQLMQANESGREDHGNRLWLLINAELWYRMAIEGQSRESLRAQISAMPSAA